jgi:hypothetical protein
VEATSLAYVDRYHAEPNAMLGCELSQPNASAGALRDAIRLIETVAGGDSTALVLGETGTGKELIARATHSRSPRRDRPFVKLNCAAIPSEMLLSDEIGAFTHASDSPPRHPNIRPRHADTLAMCAWVTQSRKLNGADRSGHFGNAVGLEVNAEPFAHHQHPFRFLPEPLKQLTARCTIS